MSSIITKVYNAFSKYLSARIIFVMDMTESFIASLVAYAIIDFATPATIVNIQGFALCWLLAGFVSSAMMFFLTKTYTVIIRHATLKASYKFALAAFGKVLLSYAAALLFIVKEGGTLSKGLLAITLVDFLATVFALLGTRVIMIVAYEIIKSRIENKKEKMRTLVYGLTDKSVATIKRLQASKHFNIVGFITYGEINIEHTIDALKVFRFSSENEVAAIKRDKEIEAILFTSEEEIRAENERLIKYAIEEGVKIFVAPQIDEMKDGKMPHAVRKIEIEDLLGRPEIKISMDQIISEFKGKTIMVTGAAGSIGSELCRQLAGFGIGKLILFDNAETPMHNLRLEIEDRWPELEFVPIIGDVRQLNRLDYAFRTYRPQVLFHAAAYKHVPLMEENPCEAVLVNVGGSRQVAEKCLEYGVEKMVMISTDKAVNPTNIMGCTKRLAEIYVQSLGLEIEKNGGKFTLSDGRVIEAHTKFVTTRFGNVLGSNGSVIPRFRDQIAKGGPVTVTHPDITRFFMTIPEACRLVMEAATMTTGNQIFVFDMGESVKIDTLARRMIKLAGFTPDKDIMVEYTGLRPGEKLYEEVLSNTENTLPTPHERIRIARVREYDYKDAYTKALSLESLSRDVNIPDMVILMKEIVPEFKSKNSPYEKYDKQ